jgi:N-acetylglucosaminyldiphosphoundecaprenol N-acetyl-beta-D-mannosaminyltransferase
VTTRQIHLQGIRIDALQIDELLSSVGALLQSRERSTIAYANVHVLNLAARDEALTDFLRQATLCYCDGIGVVIGARLVGEHLPSRLTGADWIWALAARAEREGWRIAWIGGAYGVTAAAARRLLERHPRLQVVLTSHGYASPASPRHDALLARLDEAQADIVLVGMGTPAQERWVAENRSRIDAPIVWCLGATADFVSGRVSRGPAVLHNRQEWLARLLVDPRRLWKRYLIGNPRFLLRILRERRNRPHRIER